MPLGGPQGRIRRGCGRFPDPTWGLGAVAMRESIRWPDASRDLGVVRRLLLLPAAGVAEKRLGSHSLIARILPFDYRTTAVED